ncbi:unnamed protein product, partial [Allacma fusca]
VRVMEQQLSEATSNAGSWTMGDEEKLSTLQNAVREKERVISRLECQVEEQVICLSLLHSGIISLPLLPNFFISLLLLLLLLLLLKCVL